MVLVSMASLTTLSQHDWVRIFSPIETIKEPSCLSFKYQTTYADIYTMTYNEASTNEIHRILYDGSITDWHKVKLTLEPGQYGIAFEFRNPYKDGSMQGAIHQIILEKGSCSQGKTVHA